MLARLAAHATLAGEIRRRLCLAEIVDSLLDLHQHKKRFFSRFGAVFARNTGREMAQTASTA